jgi:hypothetical protein
MTLFALSPQTYISCLWYLPIENRASAAPSPVYTPSFMLRWHWRFAATQNKTMDIATCHQTHRRIKSKHFTDPSTCTFHEDEVQSLIVKILKATIYAWLSERKQQRIILRKCEIHVIYYWYVIQTHKIIPESNHISIRTTQSTPLDADFSTRKPRSQHDNEVPPKQTYLSVSPINHRYIKNTQYLASTKNRALPRPE